MPIFLEPINRHEINEAIKNKSRLGIFTSHNSQDSPRIHTDESKIGSTSSFDSVSSSIVSDKDSDLDSDMISFTDNDRMISSLSSVQNIPITSETDMPMSIAAENSLKTTKNVPQQIESDTKKVERELIEFDMPINSIGYFDLNETTRISDVLPSVLPSKNIPAKRVSTKNVPTASESWLVDFSDANLLIMPSNNSATESTPTTDTPTNSVNSTSVCHADNISPIPPTNFLTVKTTDVSQATDPHSALIGSILASYSAPVTPEVDILTPSSTLKNVPQTQLKPNVTALPAQYGVNNGDTPIPTYGGITRGIIKPKESDDGDRLLGLLNLDVKMMLSTMKEKGTEIKSARSVPPTPATSTPFCPPSTPAPSTPSLLLKVAETKKVKTIVPMNPPTAAPIETPPKIIKEQEVVEKKVTIETVAVDTKAKDSTHIPDKIPEQNFSEEPKTNIVESISIQPKILITEKMMSVDFNSIQPKPEKKNEEKIHTPTIPFPLSSHPLSICTSHNKEFGNKSKENECIDTPQTVDLIYATNSRVLKHVEQQIQNLSTHESSRMDSCDSADYGQLADIDQRRRRRSNSYAPPSSDSTVEVRYFGHQRVVIKKK